jgi:integrase
MSKSTQVRHAGNGKPPRDFPLWIHKGTQRWCRKVRGRFFYFGKLADDPDGQAALAEWLRVKDDLLAGREPRPAGGALTVKDLANHWLTFKLELLESGELARRTFEGYRASAAFLLACVGKATVVDDLGPRDFQGLRGRMAKTWGPVRLRNEMTVVNSIFKYGLEAGLYEKPVRFGPAWAKPSAKTLRKQRAKNGPRMFTPGEIHALLEHGTTNFRAMLLLALNGGLGNADLALLPVKALDGGWLDYPRNKTGIPRRIPLWPETVEAIREVIAKRREPKDKGDGALLFITTTGLSYLDDNHRTNRLVAEYRKAAALAGVAGRTFYDARRTFQTIGEESRDLVAVQAIMGHAAASNDMSAVYRQRVSDERLRDVVGNVRAWLFGEGTR